MEKGSKNGDAEASEIVLLIAVPVLILCLVSCVIICCCRRGADAVNPSAELSDNIKDGSSRNDRNRGSSPSEQQTYDNGEGVAAATKIERMSLGTEDQGSINQVEMINTYPNNVTDEDNHGPETERKLNPT